MKPRYDLDLNKTRDAIVLYRGKRPRHVWTRQEAEYIQRELERLIPLLRRKI